MATYKVLQDIEAEDKFIGPLTLRQFIYAGVAAICAYISFFTLTKGIWVITVMLLIPMLFTGFMAWPWGRDQPTEIWLLAKLRFLIKPRKRIWDQDGIQQLVTITAPKKVEKQLTNNLSQTEVKSRLKALADTIDSRGWAVKNVNVNLYTQPSLLAGQATDRLIDPNALPNNVPSYDVYASDDILDEQNNPTAQHLSAMINETSVHRREELMEKMQAAKNARPGEEPQPNYWFMNEPATGSVPAGYSTFDTQVVTPGTDAAQPAKRVSEEDQEILKKLPKDHPQAAAFGHMKTILPLSEQKKLAKKQKNKGGQPVTHTPDPAILELANKDDWNVATIAREAKRARGQDLPDDEVVIPLH